MLSKNTDPLLTPGLCLHHVSNRDAADIQHAAAAREIADGMISVPHPYPSGEALRYITREQNALEAGHAVSFSIRLRSTGDFQGTIELRAIEYEHSQGELSFCLANDERGKGHMAEALSTVVGFGFGFEEIKLNRLYAYHLLSKPASGKILEKTGFSREGLLRQRVRKRGVYEDVALWAMLHDDWLSSAADKRNLPD